MDIDIDTIKSINDIFNINFDILEDYYNLIEKLDLEIRKKFLIEFINSNVLNVEKVTTDVSTFIYQLHRAKTGVVEIKINSDNVLLHYILNNLITLNEILSLIVLYHKNDFNDITIPYILKKNIEMKILRYKSIINNNTFLYNFNKIENTFNEYYNDTYDDNGIFYYIQMDTCSVLSNYKYISDETHINNLKEYIKKHCYKIEDINIIKDYINSRNNEYSSFNKNLSNQEKKIKSINLQIKEIRDDYYVLKNIDYYLIKDKYNNYLQLITLLSIILNIINIFATSFILLVQ